jgi:DNA-binding NtrC family response regulator
MPGSPPPPQQDTATLDALDVGAGSAGAEAFLVVHLAGEPRVVLLPEGTEVTIGRSRASTIYVDDERISRRHARIVRRGADVFAADLGSRNGTRVSGVPLAGEQRLRGGDVIEAGPLRAIVAVAGAAAAAPPPPAPRPRGNDADAEGGPDLQVIADPAMANVYELCRRVAAMPLSVLITGETGVGKERIAEAIQRASPRAAQPFVRLHVGALPETLVESELFGHERGAFTGADRRHRGYFEAASGGTLLLDEIGELPLPVQAKLLRVLESGKVIRLGSTDEIPVDVRVIAATNRDLAGEARAGRFREDLYFRLAGFRIDVPPLRQRQAEIPLLAALFARETARAASRPPVAVTPPALAALARYAWPGNIRELKHVVQAAMVMAGPGDVGVEHLPPGVRDAAPASAAAPVTSGGEALPASVERLERETIVKALNACAGNQTRAAAELGISRRTLLYKMKKLGIRSARIVD